MPDGMTAKGVPMTMTEELIKVLGGQGTIKKRVDSLQDLANIVREGIPFPSLLALSAMAHLDLNTMSRVLMIPTRTLARRRKAKRLSAEESDRLVRLARIFAHAIDVFGDQEKAAVWLRRPNCVLRNQPPIEALDTDLGSQEVDTILGRIEHGVYS